MEETEHFYEMTRDLPQLILAMDKNDGNGQYVLIQNAKEDETYYCPCCGGEVRPRAYKKDKDYQVQPHFYHINGGCTEESYIHYVCKMLLTKKDCKFKVEDKEYLVKSVDIEKTYDTTFGKYRPDVTIITSEGKIFFAEIAHTNQKTQEYLPKWDELGNDVIEIKTNEFINVIVENKVPNFKLIYSDGKCFLRKNLHEDYLKFIYDRKENWKRQDLLNYKIQWERLDWFFIKLQEYKLGKVSYEDMLKSFKQVDRIDKPILFDLIKKQSCLKDEKQQFRDIINDEMDKYFQEKVKEIKKKNKIKIQINNCENNYKIESKNLHNTLFISYCGKNIFSEFGTRKWVNNIEIVDEILIYIQNFIKKVDEDVFDKSCKEKEEKFYKKYLKKINDKILKKLLSMNLYHYYSSSATISSNFNIELSDIILSKDFETNTFDIDYENFTIHKKPFPIQNCNIKEIVDYIILINNLLTKEQKQEKEKEKEEEEKKEKKVNDLIVEFIYNLESNTYIIDYDDYDNILSVKINTYYNKKDFNYFFSNDRHIAISRLVDLTDDEIINSIKKDLLQDMTRIRDNFNKMDGNNYARRFIVNKEEI